MKYVVEFKNDTYLQHIKIKQGGPLSTAQKFNSAEEAGRYMKAHDWILANDGMVVPIGEINIKNNNKQVKLF